MDAQGTDVGHSSMKLIMFVAQRKLFKCRAGFLDRAMGETFLFDGRF